MTEAERLQKLVSAQAAEIKRLRRTIATVRIASIEVDIDETQEEHTIIHIVCTAIGVDEFHFIDQTKGELTKLVERLVGQQGIKVPEIKDAVTGGPVEGEVMPA